MRRRLMKKYIYEVTGEYKDWLKMKKGDIVVHNGSLIELISYSNNRLELKLNYGKDVYYPCEIKKTGDIMITIPMEEFCLKDDYLYIPLIFNQEEYEELIQICYIDRKLLNNVQYVNKKDVYNLLSIQFKLEFGLSETLNFKYIFNNIIAFSEYDEEIAQCIRAIKSKECINIQRLDKNNSKTITLFVDFSGNLYEWNSVIKAGDKFYFKLVDDYALELDYMKIS